MKKVLLFIAGFLLVVLSSGCATTTQTVGGAAYGFGSGVVKDTKDTTNAIMKADEWFRENCW